MGTDDEEGAAAAPLTNGVRPPPCTGGQEEYEALWKSPDDLYAKVYILIF
jgi:hypothetical protein